MLDSLLAPHSHCCVTHIVFRIALQKGRDMLAICPLASLPRGEARRVDTSPPIAVFHTDDGEILAIDDTCTHQDASLADGWVEGCEVECPLHAPAKLPVRTHRVVVRDGMIHVHLSAEEPNLPPDVRRRLIAPEPS
jgi:3-phenylpropionate/trans-cinnamate dioxygenase ferredoxin subunit